MNEFDTELSDNIEMSTPDLYDAENWSEFDSEIIDNATETVVDSISETVLEDNELQLEKESLSDNDLLTDSEKAADYARSLGFDKAADYIDRHYDGDEFIPGEPIPITTRNMALEGSESENGIHFERRTAELTDGLSVEGVFPVFDSKHHVELGTDANDMSLYQQFNACREDFQDHMYDSPEKLESFTFGDMERLELPQGYTPEGYTWQHNPETGSFDLVSKDDHSVGHTGGNALWGQF